MGCPPSDILPATPGVCLLNPSAVRALFAVAAFLLLAVNVPTFLAVLAVKAKKRTRKISVQVLCFILVGLVEATLYGTMSLLRALQPYEAIGYSYGVTIVAALGFFCNSLSGALYIRQFSIFNLTLLAPDRAHQRAVRFLSRFVKILVPFFFLAQCFTGPLVLLLMIALPSNSYALSHAFILGFYLSTAVYSLVFAQVCTLLLVEVRSAANQHSQHERRIIYLRRGVLCLSLTCACIGLIFGLYREASTAYTYALVLLLLQWPLVSLAGLATLISSTEMMALPLPLAWILQFDLGSGSLQAVQRESILMLGHKNDLHLNTQNLGKSNNVTVSVASSIVW